MSCSGADASPLEEYLSERMGGSVARRVGLQKLTKPVGGSLGKLLRRKIWKWPHRHMRSYPWHLGKLDPVRPGAWKITVDGKHITDTVPMDSWIGKIDRPVTIVAGGPSARTHPLGELNSSGRLVVALNGVPTLLAEYGVVPDAWIVADLRLTDLVLANCRHAAGTPLAIPAAVASRLAKSSPEELSGRPVCVIERVNQWHGTRSLANTELDALNLQSGTPFVFPPMGKGKSIVGWSHRPELGFFSGCTVALVALQILVRLGARDIEIIGMDLTGNAHAYADGKGSYPSTLDDDYEQSILPSFALMSEALEGSGVRVKNLSPVCRLPREYFAA